MGQVCVRKSRDTDRTAEQRTNIAAQQWTPDLELPPVPAGTCRLYLIRHGHSMHNDAWLRNRLDTKPVLWDAPLHATGVEQAGMLCRALRDIPFDLCVTSPLTRAIQTGLIALGDWDDLSDGLPEVDARTAAVTALDLRCPYIALPELAEQLQGSDDIGSAAPELRRQFPSVDFGRLPTDGRAWWHLDQRYLGAAADVATSRKCWLEHGLEIGQSHNTEQGYYEFGPTSDAGEGFVARMSTLNQLLRRIVTVGEHTHVVVSSHCWVLRELWQMHFGQKRKFRNAEVGIVDLSSSGEWTKVISFKVLFAKQSDIERIQKDLEGNGRSLAGVSVSHGDVENKRTEAAFTMSDGSPEIEAKTSTKG